MHKRTNSRAGARWIGPALLLAPGLAVSMAIFAGPADAADGPKKQAPRGDQAIFDYPPDIPGARAEVFKTVDDAELRIWIYNPEGHDPEHDRRPGIVFFFGGGFTHGSPAQFAKQSEYFASRGIVAMTADYRVKDRHGNEVVECVVDGKSAVRWVRANAARLGVDPGKIIAGGGSAGGFIAAGCALVRGLDDEGEDLSISSVPDALVLFNPAWMGESVPSRKGARAKSKRRVEPEHLPYNHIRENLPPMIMFFGTEDGLLAGAEQFQDTAVAEGNRCELKTWKGVGHGFFNLGRNGNKEWLETVELADVFLESLGYLDGKPTISAEFLK